ncbi:MAG: squalene/phytoene synthase family protein [Verrucomicrobiota bacterium]|nr:squalene/phytoene synthase family protein [Verrucomicrobiota bacterium]
MTPGLNNLLRATSRSFYLTLRALPGAIRPQIGLAYLLARTTDTIADTDIVPPDRRLDALQRLRESILAPSSAPTDFGDLAQHQASPAEKLLLEKAEDSLSALRHFSAADQRLIREVLAVITSGQELDLRRFAKSSAANLVALETDGELDDYTWRVAGCVGEFWTKLCRAHLFPRAKLDDRPLLADGVRFGKGLQLVNILRDLPADLRKGRCYLPKEQLAGTGLAPADLLSPANEPRLRPVYRRYLDLAESHLAAGWNYTNSLPFRCVRVRLACAWPILIGVKTIGRLRAGNVLDPRCRVKISRGEVRAILLRSALASPLPGLWRRLFPAAKGVALDGQVA